MKKSILFVIIYISAPLLLLANGMPFRTSYVYKASNPMPMNVSGIKILKESIKIKIHRDMSIVNVEYAMKNEGEDISIDYGFPVDYFLRSKSNDPAGLWNPDNIREFSLIDENGELEVFEKADSLVYPGKLKSRMIMYDKVDITRRWFFAKLLFSKGMEKYIKVSYAISNTVIDFLMSDMYFLLYSDRVFTYDFSPASLFGEGIIGELDIQIDLSELESCNCEYFTEFGETFENKDGVLTLRMNNVNLSKLKELTIKYRMDNVYKAEAGKNYRFGFEWFKSFKTKNNIRKNDFSCLFDGIPTTGLFVGNGAGSALDIEFGKDSVSYIGFINGNLTNRQSYYDYPRIKSLKIEIYSKTLRKYTGKNYLILEFKDKDYNYFNDLYYGSYMTALFDLGTDFYDDIKKIRLKVLDVYPGKKYKQLSIGEIFVYKYKAYNSNPEGLFN